MSDMAPPKTRGEPAGLDSFVVSSLRGTFGFGASEAEHVARTHKLARDDVKLWEAFLEARAADGKTKNPKAYTASLMRQYRTPPTPNRPDGKPEGPPRDPRLAKLGELARRGAWWVGAKGTRWEYEQHGMFNKAMGVVPYVSIPPELLERLVAEARVGEAG